MRARSVTIYGLLAATVAVTAPTAVTAAAAAPPAAKPLCTAQTRACLEATARTYIDGLLSHSGTKLPLAPAARRTENALTNAKGEEIRESFVRTDMIERIKGIRLYTDVAKGEVVAFFTLDIDLKDSNGGGQGTTKAGDTEYKVAVSKPAGTYTVHEAERFKIVRGRIQEIEIIAQVEDGKGMGSGWPVERDAAVKKAAK